MPPRTPKPPPGSQEIVRGLKDAIRQKDPADYIGLKHRVSVAPLDGGVPIIVTIELSRSLRGLYVATCLEFPGLVVTGNGEQDALIKAELEVRHRLAGDRRP
jgi:hypothetical protein